MIIIIIILFIYSFFNHGSLLVGLKGPRIFTKIYDMPDYHNNLMTVDPNNSQHNVASVGMQ